MTSPALPAGFGAMSGPIPLASKGMGLPAKPGVYVVACGDCIVHIGTSGNVAGG